ncbi:MAG TPA: HAD-IA family hydrolase [Solirubrobacteraceae bacterium]
MTGAYLVDLDGVLVDSLGAAIRSWTWWASLHGLDPGPFIRAHGRPSREAIAELAPALDADAEAALVEEREIGDTDVVALPGATAMLAAARPVAIVTSGGRRLAEARLRAAGLQRPEVLVSVDSISRGKPDPEPYLYGAQRLQISPSRCTVFEDAPAGVAAGKAAGMRVVALTTTVGAEELAGADRIVRDLAEYLDGGVS